MTEQDLLPQPPMNEEEYEELQRMIRFSGIEPTSFLQNDSIEHSTETTEYYNEEPIIFTQAIKPEDDSMNDYVSVANQQEIPCLDDFPGPFVFDICSHNKDTSSSYIYSQKLNKLFIENNRTAGFQVKIAKWDLISPALTVRAMPVYSKPSDINEPVVRCLNHRQSIEDSNQGFWSDKTEHIIRSSLENAMYDNFSGRYSVVVPLAPPSVGSTSSLLLYKFMCNSSCPSGINRRPMKILFTLELNGDVVGRKLMDIRICACPLRDCRNEVKKFDLHNENKDTTVGVNPPRKTKMPKRPPQEEESEDDDCEYLLKVRGKKNAKIIKFWIDTLNQAEQLKKRFPDIAQAACSSSTSSNK